MRHIIAALFLIMAFQIKAQTINSEKSTVDFEVKNFKINTVEGKLSGLKGEVTFNINQIEKSSFNVQIPISTIDTDNSKRDEHLQGEDYFNAENHPYISFKSNQVGKNESGTILVKGSLSIKGITKEIELPFNYKQEGTQGILSTSFTIDRYDYKVGGDGGFSIGREVIIQVNCVLEY